MTMNFDSYMCGIMTLNPEYEKDAEFLFKQLLLLRDSDKGIAAQVVIQHVINLKLTNPGLIK